MALPLEFVSYYVCKVFFLPRGLIFTEKSITQEEYDTYMNERDPDLGWHCAKVQCSELDEIGSRRIPNFPNPMENPAVISAYGDSYTFSNRTKPKNSWCNKLSGLIGQRVNNFGVSGYGTDQAFMRYHLNEMDTAQYVILNHFVFDIMRNVNQHWGTRFSVEGQKLGLKPRYILNNNELDLVELPKPSYEEFSLLLEKPEEYFEHEYYLPNTEYGSVKLKFPFTLSLIRTLIFHTKFHSLYKGEPVHTPFYKKDHSTGSLQLTYKIMSDFVKLAKERNQIPIIHIIPFSEDLEYFEKNGKWSYQELLALLDSSGIFYINSGREILDKKISNYEEIYAGEGHFNARGDSVLAEILAEKIKIN